MPMGSNLSGEPSSYIIRSLFLINSPPNSKKERTFEDCVACYSKMTKDEIHGNRVLTFF